MLRVTQDADQPPDEAVNMLLVDDLPANLLVLEAILGDLGQNLVRAHSGEEALRLLERQDFAVVLLDVRMPGLDGFETARRMRARPETLHTPIIFISAQAGDEFPLIEAYKLGAVDYLVKPLVPDILRAKVSGFIEVIKERDHARREAEVLRMLIHDTKDYAIFRLSPQGIVSTWNLGAERLKGYKAEEIIGQHFSRFYPQESIDSGWPQHELAVAVETGRFEDEGWRLRKDGSRFWADVSITALRNEAGELVGFSKVTRDLTERRAAEENALRLATEEAARVAAEESAQRASRAQANERRHREQLQVTLTSIGDAVIVTDTHGMVTFLNPVAEALTGWPAGEAAGQPLEAIFPIINEESRRTVENPVTRVLREGVTVGLANHTLLIRRDGEEMPIDDSAAPIRGEDGEVAGVVLVFRDVTEARKAIEARLHLAAIVESSDDAIISKTLDGTIVSWNRGAEQLYGYTAEEMIGQRLSILVPPSHPDELPELMQRITRGERVEHFETVRVAKDGRRLDVSLTISPVRNSEGKIVGASKIARDITAAKRQEASLRFVAEASRLLAEVTDVPSTLQRVASLAVPHFADWCTVDMLQEDGEVEQMAVAHVDPGKVELARDLQRNHPPDPAALVGVPQILRTGQSEILEEIPDSLLEAMVKDPERLRMMRELGLRSYIGVALRLRGQVIGVLTFIGAESQQRFTMADLRLAENLAERAATAIENARLYHQLKLADQRKDEFLAMLGHELRNPLASIRNALQLMKAPQATGDMIADARETSERQLQHMVRLVDDLLDVSRIMRGRVEIRREMVELEAIVRQGAEIAQPMIDAHGQQLIVSLPAKPLYLEADPSRLTQVVSNLLHNAAKFSPHAGRIWLSLEQQGTQAVLHIKDEGAGIRADLLPHVFELFVQGNQTLERTQGGLGIGLTVVRRLIEMHGGNVTAASEGLGLGAEFTITLPGLCEPPPQAAGKTARKVAAIPRRVLVVDDNVDSADMVALLLKLSGHQVRLAHTGPDALTAAEDFLPELILLDIGLPGMNGYEVARHLRQQPQFAATVLAALTGYGQESDRQRSKEAGFDLHYVKPLAPKALEALVADPRGSIEK